MLAFFPGQGLAPIYDMLPMGYAPQPGGEVPPHEYRPPLPLPVDATAWRKAGEAALAYWRRCAEDPLISEEFRAICAANHGTLRRVLD
ncbi:MAG: hypothetical protein FD187_409 [bacterium]|nr:MAG: hypothetical protein FD142_331 [bacterium]KAF0150174.1 MAG: hypothetical protein FD187_409 [bacterium]KAF0169654.1 MAG: hypothetical protein FD158_41 [bacterium]TXT22954.1 MAG: hypothetical protein FD132_156 [bacterium]